MKEEVELNELKRKVNKKKRKFLRLADYFTFYYIFKYFYYYGPK